MTEVKDGWCSFEQAIEEVKKMPRDTFQEKGNVVLKCQQLMPNIRPPMSMESFISFVFKIYPYEFANRAILLDTYFRLDTTSPIGFTEFLDVVKRLNGGSEPKIRRDTIIALKGRIYIPSWEQLFRIFETDCLYELEIFVAYISIMDSKPSHSYILKVLQKYVHNKQKHDIIAELHKHKLFPAITSIPVYRMYINVLNHDGTGKSGKMAESDQKFMNDIVLLLSDLLKSDEKSDHKTAVYAYKFIFGGQVYDYTIDWNTGEVTGLPDIPGLTDKPKIFTPAVGIQFL